MKKYLYSALALPLLFACSSDDLFEKEAVSNDQFAGIEKVDATFSMDEALTRMDDGSWNPQEGDLWGFAWLGDGTQINPSAKGWAYQNHNLIQTDGIFKPQTSIYVGKYYIYRPYDATTVSPQAINFKSLETQTIAEGYKSTTDAWKNLAKTAINIGSKWTVVGAGWEDAEHKTWDKSGIGQNYKIYAAMFSNQTGLDLTYTQNDPAFTEDKVIKGATDIELTLNKGLKVGAAKIYGGTIELEGQAKSFTYAPTASPENEAYDAVPGHNGEFWADKSATSTFKVANGQNGFTFTGGEITLNVDNGGVETEGKTNGWLWFNSLPVTAGTGSVASTVTPVFETTYGKVTAKKSYDPATAYTVGDCAYAFEQPHGGAAGYESEAKEWIKLNDETDDDLTKGKDQKTWKLSKATHNTFINQYGNHKGKYSVNVDFSKGVMNDMHIKDDAHLQQALKYYIASGKDEVAVLNLDGAGAKDKTFKLSKISIALLQTINKDGVKVTVKACGVAAHNAPEKIIITQEGSTGKTEVPALNKVFAAATDVYLSSDCTWTWSDNIKTKVADVDVVGNLTIDAGVKSITNMGTLNVTTANIQLSVAAATLGNAKGATMNITKVTTVKNALTNLGIINVGADDNHNAELRAYNVNVVNDATKLNEQGLINNWGVVGVTYGTAGQVFNYGTIDMKHVDAITLLKSNQEGGNFQSAFAAATNKMGTVKLPNGAPNALVSVDNGTENGFIEYVWDGGKGYSTPNGGTVKYNTLIVNRGDISFSSEELEIQYIKFNNTRTYVYNTINKGSATDKGKLTQLKAIIVNEGKSIVIEKGNGIRTSNSAHLYSGAAIYNGGVFDPQNASIGGDGKTVTDYLGKWSTDQIVKF